jgi:hypothetical protein
MRVIILLFITILAGGCQLQVNLASPVNNITVIKTQNDSGDMQGSKLDDITEGPDEAGDVSLPIP